MKRKLLLLALLILAVQAFAQDEEEEVVEKKAPAKKTKTITKKKGLIGEYAEPQSSSYYGMAGCGLGSVLFGESEHRGGQILASTTNGIYSNDTFGMSSGTSNCSAERRSKTADVKKNIDLFVAANREALATDLAKNNGDSIVALAQIAGCKDSTKMAQTLNQNYETIFASTREQEVSNNIYKAMLTQNDLAKNCQI